MKTRTVTSATTENDNDEKPNQQTPLIRMAPLWIRCKVTFTVIGVHSIGWQSFNETMHWFGLRAKFHQPQTYKMQKTNRWRLGVERKWQQMKMKWKDRNRNERHERTLWKKFTLALGGLWAIGKYPFLKRKSLPELWPDVRWRFSWCWRRADLQASSGFRYYCLEMTMGDLNLC